MDNTKKVKRQSTEWEKIFGNHISDKHPEYIKLLQLDNKKKNNQLKCAKK